jgi:hypothetical protein
MRLNLLLTFLRHFFEPLRKLGRFFIAFFLDPVIKYSAGHDKKNKSNDHARKDLFPARHVSGGLSFMTRSRFLKIFFGIFFSPRIFFFLLRLRRIKNGTHSPRIISAAQCKIRKHAVSFGNFLETFFRTFRPGIYIRVITFRKPPVSKLDILFACIIRNAKCAIMIFHERGTKNEPKTKLRKAKVHEEEAMFVHFRFSNFFALISFFVPF